MFDNLFFLIGPIGSAGIVVALLGLVAAPMFWETCALSKGMRASR